ncbi:MAG: TOBE domain-containing protein [Candidatus Thorarchaeota archaeon]|nr:TOBE domain-containing protein [Candidatus Thorarchaeota archaeon]
MSDRIAVIKSGRTLQIGTPTEIYERPKSGFVADFIGRSNLFEGSYANGVVEVDGLGRIIVEPERQVFDKRSVVVGVKPEKISIERTLKGLDNIFDGEVKETYYQGQVTTYRVLLENDSLITVVVLSIGMKDIFRYGEKVKVGWNKEDAKLII